MRIPAAAFTILLLLAGAATVPAAGAQDWAFTLYGGRLTEEVWEKAISPTTDFADAYLVAGALSRTVLRFFDDALAFEIEAQAVKHFGDQEHLEFNLPLAARWRKFPWGQKLATSFAFGAGPSYATREPAVEKDLSQSTSRLLLHWFGELTLGPPKAPWALALRLHHRSPAYGLFGDHGGSNALAAGIKYRF